MVGTGRMEPETKRELAKPRTLGVLAFALVLGSLAVALFLVDAHFFEHFVTARYAWPILAMAFVLADVADINVELRENAVQVTLAPLAIVLGLVSCTPSTFLIARLIGGAIGLRFKKQKGLKAGFNLGWFSLEACVALLMFDAVHSAVPVSGSTATFVAGFAATVATRILGGVVILAVIQIASGRPHWKPLPQVLLLSSLSALGLTSLGLLAVTVLTRDPTAIWLVLIIASVLYAAYRGYNALRQRYANLQLFYRFTRVLARSPELTSAIETTLNEAREVLRAGGAEVYLLPAPGESVGMRVRVSGEAPVTTTRLTGAELADLTLSDVVTHRRPLLMARNSKQEILRRRLAAWDVKDLLVAPLIQADAVIGTISVFDRMGDVSTFDGEDLKVFETLANHAGVSLENARLIDRLRREAAEKAHQALHDALTGLANRALFALRTDEALEMAGGVGQAAVLLMDLNRFKDVNDTLGHHHGDLLLKEVATRLSAAVPTATTVARLGGDEFAILLPSIGGVRHAEVTAEQLERALERPFTIGGIQLAVSAAIGIAVAPDHGTDALTLLQRADIAMYSAKREQHSGVAIYQPDRDQHTRRRLALAAELRLAIEQGDLAVYYQPKADLASGRVTGIEALVRWNHPVHGFIPPDEFVPLAESVGLIGPLTTYVLTTALADCRTLDAAGQDLDLAVNLSPRSLLDLSLPTQVLDLLNGSGIAPRRLTLEITETSMMSDHARSTQVLELLDDLGVTLSIDDFGTGYASLAYLRKLPVDEVKIDRSFVFRMTSDDTDARLVRSIIDLANNLGLRVVAEGVEDEETWTALTQLGCDVVQGFLLSRPVPPEELLTWLRHRLAISV
jgi:diguanylate cyclase (GGDEF)-like protein